MLVRALLPATLLLVLAACQQDEGHGADQQGSATDSAPSAGAAVPFDPAALMPQLSLKAAGLLVGSRQSPTTVDFGTARPVTERMVETALGEPSSRTANAECGAGAMEFTSYGALQLAFQDDRFVGWFLDSGSDIVTSDGIRTGETRADLESERSVVVNPESTLEGEFAYAVPDGSEIGGFFAGEGAAATIHALYAGQNCFFR